MMFGHPEGNITQIAKAFVLGLNVALRKFDDLCADDTTK